MIPDMTDISLMSQMMQGDDINVINNRAHISQMSASPSYISIHNENEGSKTRIRLMPRSKQA